MRRPPLDSQGHAPPPPGVATRGVWGSTACSTKGPDFAPVTGISWLCSWVRRSPSLPLGAALAVAPHEVAEARGRGRGRDQVVGNKVYASQGPGIDVCSLAPHSMYFVQNTHPRESCLAKKSRIACGQLTVEKLLDHGYYVVVPWNWSGRSAR